jgi:hypothetical protein
MFRIDAPPGPAVALTCDLAVDAREALAACNLVQTRPIEIRLKQHLVGARQDCLGLFECDRDRLSLVAPEAISRNLAEGDAYTLLPPDAVYRALLTHELAHGLLSQTTGERPIPQVDQEYVAAAMEFGTFLPRHRQILLEATPTSRPVEPEAISIWVYLMNPRGFGVRAWTHFQDHGCDVVRAIVDGSFTFHMDEV